MSWFNKKAKPSEESDEDLLENYRASGDLVYLGRLFEKYMPLIYGVCLKYLKNEELAKDAVMQLFEELTEKVNKFEIKNFKSWVYVLTRNHCLMQLRVGYRVKYEDVDDVVESAFILHPDSDDREEYLKILDLCIQSLNSGQKQCVNLFYFEEKSYREIVDETGFTINEVKSFIQNGKRNLKICMERNHGQ